MSTRVGLRSSSCSRVRCRSTANRRDWNRVPPTPTSASSAAIGAATSAEKPTSSALASSDHRERRNGRADRHRRDDPHRFVDRCVSPHGSVEPRELVHDHADDQRYADEPDEVAHRGRVGALVEAGDAGEQPRAADRARVKDPRGPATCRIAVRFAYSAPRTRVALPTPCRCSDADRTTPNGPPLPRSVANPGATEPPLSVTCKRTLGLVPVWVDLISDKYAETSVISQKICRWGVELGSPVTLVSLRPEAVQTFVVHHGGLGGRVFGAALPSRACPW